MVLWRSFWLQSMKTLPAAQLLLHHRDHELRVLLLEHLREPVRERLGVVVGDRGVERHVELHALRARGLREALQAELGEHVAQQHRHLAALGQRGRRAGVEVEGEHGGRVGVLGQRQRGMQLQVGEVGEPDEGRQVVAEHEVDRPVAGAGSARTCTHSGACEGFCFS